MKEPQILRRDSVLFYCGITGNSSLYDLMKEGLFPKPVKIGKRAVGWRKSDLDAWLDGLEYTTDHENEVQDEL